jgi:hypothetical protein
MLIIIEGVDCTGKSTLAKELVDLAAERDDAVRYIHSGPPTAHPIVEYEYALSGYKPGVGVSVICDRWHLGADVYGPLKRNDNGLDVAVRWHIEQYLRSRGALLVHAVPESIEKMHEMMRSRGEDYIDENEAVLAADMFDDAAERSMLPLTSSSIPHNAKSIFNMAVKYEEQAAPLAAFSSYIGPRRPRALLLGDVKNRNGADETDMLAEAAFVPYKMSSGTFLLNAMLHPSVDASRNDDIGIANANEEDLGRLWDMLHTPRVVALGKAAQAACDRAHVPYKAAEHPAYVRRFLRNDIVAYGRKLV